MSKVGDRKNAGKLRWRNVPLFLLEPLMQVGAKGEEKYATFNFLKGMYVNDCLDSLKRHLTKLESPFEPDEDEESGVSHAGHIAWNALVIAFMLKTRPDLDDRYKPEKKTKKLKKKKKR